MSEKYNDDGSVSQQWLAEQIASEEGGVKEIDIAQIKEILKITLTALAGLTEEEVNVLLEKHR